MSILNVATNSRGQVLCRKLSAKLDIESPNVQTTDVPTDGWFKMVASSFGLKENKVTLTSDSFDASLMLPNLKGGNISVEGGSKMNLLKEGQEFLYEMLFGGTWVHTDPSNADGRATHTLLPNPSTRPLPKLIYKGTIDMSSGSGVASVPALDGTNKAGDVYKVSVAGTADVNGGDLTASIGDYIYFDENGTYSVILEADQVASCFLLERQIKSQFKNGYKVFANCFIDSFNLNVPQDGIASADVNVFSEFTLTPTDTQRSVGAVPEIFDDFFVGHRGQIKLRARDLDGNFTQVEYVPDFIRGCNLNINANLIKDAYTFRENRDASVYVSTVDYNRRSITGSLDMYFTANTDIETAFRDLSSMQLILELEEDGYITSFILPEIKFTAPNDPDIAQGDGFTQFSLDFTAIKHVEGADEYDIKVEITDSNLNFGTNWEDTFDNFTPAP